tara:strand:- start:18644 stop:19612 length:969 start_codon:yes stop_codon:yes gene_type:complete
LKVNNKTVGIIVNPNSGKDIRRLVSNAFVVPQQYKSNELIKLYEGLSTYGVNKVFVMPDFSDVSKRAREKYSNLIDTEILKTKNLDDESTTIESAKQMNNLSLDCVIIFGGDGTARLATNYINNTPILAISTGTNNLFPENIDGTIAGIAVGKFINSEKRESYCRRHKKLDIYFDKNYMDSALVDVVATDIPYVGAKAVWDMESVSEIFINKIRYSGIGFSSIGFSLIKNLKSEEAIYIKISKNKNKSKILKSPIAPGKIEEIFIDNWKLFKEDEIIKIQTNKGTLALDGERRLEFNNLTKPFVKINKEGPLCLKIKEILSN